MPVAEFRLRGKWGMSFDMFGWLKSLFGGEEPASPAREVTLTTLAPGDVVVHLDVTYMVEQRITYHQSGFFWFDYRLDDGGGNTAWLSVTDDDELELAFFRPTSFQPNLPPPRQFEHEGVAYELDEHGVVDAKIDRGTGTETRTRVEAWDYEGENGELLGIQRWGEGEIEVMLGRAVRPVELDLLPGDGQR